MSDHETDEPGVRWDFKVSDQVSGGILRCQVCHETDEPVGIVLVLVKLPPGLTTNNSRRESENALKS